MATIEREFTRPDGLRVRVRRSTRRVKSVGAAWRDGVAVVSLPARLSAREEAHWVEVMLTRMLGREKARTPRGDDELQTRAVQLSDAHLEGRARPSSVRWVGNQQRRWGSTTPLDRTIRLSDRLRSMPRYVQDYVLVHELAHLLADDGHGPLFRSWERRFPRWAEAKAFLAGVSWAEDRGAQPSIDGTGHPEVSNEDGGDAEID